MDPFVGEVRLFACTFAPVGWALCQGQTLAISSNTALFSLLGTYYGGNGTSNFQLPNLQGYVIAGVGQGPGLSPYVIGQTAGTTTVTLGTAQMPAHTHSLPAGSTGLAGNTPSPSTYLASPPGSGRAPGAPLYATPATQSGSAVTMNGAEAGLIGGSQPHNNLAPYLVLNYCIATQGIYPARN